jgi:hypothetical protein
LTFCAHQWLLCTRSALSVLILLQGPGKLGSDEKIYEQTEKIVADLRDKWDKTEEKPAAVGLTVAALVGLYVLNGIVGAIDTIPVVSGILELVGIFVTSWFVYRYLVFGPGAFFATIRDLATLTHNLACAKQDFATLKHVDSRAHSSVHHAKRRGHLRGRG